MLLDKNVKAIDIWGNSDEFPSGHPKALKRLIGDYKKRTKDWEEVIISNMTKIMVPPGTNKSEAIDKFKERYRNSIY